MFYGIGSLLKDTNNNIQINKASIHRKKNIIQKKQRSNIVNRRSLTLLRDEKKQQNDGLCA